MPAHHKIVHFADADKLKDYPKTQAGNPNAEAGLEIIEFGQKRIGAFDV
jgi:hypothetical protein